MRFPLVRSLLLLFLSQCISSLPLPFNETDLFDAIDNTTTNTGSEGISIFDSLPVQPEVDVCDEMNAPGRSTIYCSGRLLDAVNLNQLFSDSKTFVDRPIKSNFTDLLINQAFSSSFSSNSNIDRQALLSFVDNYFDPEGNELEQCNVTDWTTQPASFDVIQDADMRQFAYDLNNIWKVLCRRVKPEVRDEPHRFSLLYVPNNIIIPGGRFREFYYWDTYWIIKGLLASGMNETPRGMIANLASMVDQFGFVPNGGRVYYLRRSQPPLLTAMVYEYYQATRNATFVQEMLPLLEKELQFWKDQRAVNVEVDGQTYTMYQYRTAANVPRPESYREDVTNGQNIPSEGRRQLFYQDIGSAAESGWDFSTRWFADGKTLVSIRTTDIVPVDLNSFFCYNLHILSFLHGVLGNDDKQRSWIEEYYTFRTNFQKVFYVNDAKGWYDFYLHNKTHNTDFYASIAIPLFTECYEPLSNLQANDLYDQMDKLGALAFVGGIPTSMANKTQEQWDFPNGWSPLNHMIIEGLRKSDNPRLQRKAYELAVKWVRGNYRVWKADGAMWEKYNVASNVAKTGGGGEYEVQAGFGWTNGAVLDLLMTYGDRLNDVDDPSLPSHFSSYPSSTSLPLSSQHPQKLTNEVPSHSIHIPSLFTISSLLIVAFIH